MGKLGYGTLPPLLVPFLLLSLARLVKVVLRLRADGTSTASKLTTYPDRGITTCSRKAACPNLAVQLVEYDGLNIAPRRAFCHGAACRWSFRCAIGALPRAVRRKRESNGSFYQHWLQRLSTATGRPRRVTAFADYSRRGWRLQTWTWD